VAKNRKIYEEAVRAGANYAWERQWDQAVAAYQQALAEFPEDGAALAGIGLAFSEAGRTEDALSAYQRAARFDTENPALLERVAHILEQLGRAEEAADAFIEAADRYMRRQAPTLALERWQDAVRAHPGCVTAHARLLQTYLAQKDTQKALAQYLALAEVYRVDGRTDQAMELLQYALRMAPRNPEVLAMMDRLRFGDAAPDDVVETGPLDPSLVDLQGSPVELTRQKALTDLAEAVFSETPPQTGPLIMRPLSKSEVDTLISKALDSQTRGDIEDAIASYERVLQAGVIKPAVNFNLGLLYQQQLRFDEAVTQFQQSIGDPTYRLGSHFALGECYRARGRIDEALTHFIEVLKIVDLATVQREQVDDLIQLYEELARTYAAKGEREQAVEFLNSLIGFLGAKGWEDKVTHTRDLLNAVTREGPILSLAEMLSTRDAERILQSLGLAQEYLRREMQDAALDELDHAILLAPNYLPTHRQMGELLLRMGKVDHAVSKFLTLADLYQVRGNPSQAMAMYERALNVAPMDVAVREKLIDLLISHGEIDRALEQYLVLADTYYQMAQFDRAREKYNKALRLAPRGSPERRWGVRILHRIADIDVQRADWRRAVSTYEEIRNLAPDDERSRLTLMDLYERFGQPARSIMELDALLKALRDSGKKQKIIPVLHEIVQERPAEIPIRTRLAQAYLDARDVQGALEQLDVLGELQLQAGRTQDAIRTVQTILRLNPADAVSYQQLLQQLQTGQSPT
jgi:tetratricopeptide (TPR) repeat protein